MDTLPPYLVHQILKRSSFEDRLITLQRVCVDWKRWTPLDDLGTLKISHFERLRSDPSLWRRQTPSTDYFQSNQKWLEALLEDVIPRAGAGIKRIHFDSVWPRVNDMPPLFCAPEGFKRWTLTKPMLELIQSHCGRSLKELKLIEDNFVYTEIAPDAYPLLCGFPKLKRLAVARVDSQFGPYLRQLSLTSLAISGENAPLDTAEPEKLEALHLSHPFPSVYGNHASFYLSRHFPNLEEHSEQLLVEFDQLSETAQRKRLADYRHLRNFKGFQIQLGPDNGVRTELQSISGYGLPKLRGSVNLQVRQSGELATNVRFLSQLRNIRIEGTLNFEDAIALFTGLPDLENLTLSCHWITDDQHELSLLIDDTIEIAKEDPKISVSKLRNFQLTLWEKAPKWLRSILKDVFASASSLKSFKLQDFSNDDQDDQSIIEDIGIHKSNQYLKRLDIRIGSGKASKGHLESLLQYQWPKLSSFTWHATKLEIDQDLSSVFVNSFPNLKRFILVPPSGPLRPLLPSQEADDGLCHFQQGSLAIVLNSLKKLKEIRLFATSILDEHLVQAIDSHKCVKTVKLWDAFLPEENLDFVLSQFNASISNGLDRKTDGTRKRPLFVEIFTLRTPGKKLSEHALRLNDGNIFFLANGRVNAIDEQTFYFP